MGLKIPFRLAQMLKERCVCSYSYSSSTVLLMPGLVIWNFELGLGLVNNIYNSRNYVNYDKLLD